MELSAWVMRFESCRADRAARAAGTGGCTVVVLPGFTWTSESGVFPGRVPLPITLLLVGKGLAAIRAPRRGVARRTNPPETR